MIWTYFVVGFGLGAMAGATLALFARDWEVRLLRGCLRRCEDENARLRGRRGWEAIGWQGR